MSESKKLILIDGNAIVHRAFYAIPQHFRTKEGELVNAVFGFASMLLNLLNHEKPDYIAASFDLRGKTFRHEEYKEYKATRTKAPDGLYDQFPRIKDMVATFGIPIYEIQGFEADDVLGTLALQAQDTPHLHTYIVTGDMDATQLVNEKVSVLSPVKGFNEKIVYDPAAVREKYGLEPSQITDLKGLQGDSSDNIKGVKGIGQKTATTLLQKYGNIETIYERLNEITGKTQEKLAADKDSAFFSKKLATIITHVEMNLNLEDCAVHEYDQQKVAELFEQLQFNSLLGKLGRFNKNSSERMAAESGIQQTLF